MKEYSSKSIRIRLVEESDAEFILSLRLDSTYNKFLSNVDNSVDSQRKWIKKYKADEQKGNQFYFIIENKLKNIPCGTVRIYDLKPSSFCWGSWILNENKSRYAALESAFLVYEFGFKHLGFSKSHFDVMKENKNVISFHEKMGAQKISEDETNAYFEISQQDVDLTRDRLKSKLC